MGKKAAEMEQKHNKQGYSHDMASMMHICLGEVGAQTENVTKNVFDIGDKKDPFQYGPYYMALCPHHLEMSSTSSFCH